MAFLMTELHFWKFYCELSAYRVLHWLSSAVPFSESTSWYSKKSCCIWYRSLRYRCSKCDCGVAWMADSNFLGCVGQVHLQPFFRCYWTVVFVKYLWSTKKLISYFGCACAAVAAVCFSEEWRCHAFISLCQKTCSGTLGWIFGWERTEMF